LLPNTNSGNAYWPSSAISIASQSSTLGTTKSTTLRDRDRHVILETSYWYRCFFMASPPEVPFLFAPESAMDELAVALNINPLEPHRRNDTIREPTEGCRTQAAR